MPFRMLGAQIVMRLRPWYTFHLHISYQQSHSIVYR